MFHGCVSHTEVSVVVITTLKNQRAGMCEGKQCERSVSECRGHTLDIKETRRHKKEICDDVYEEEVYKCVSE